MKKILYFAIIALALSACDKNETQEPIFRPVSENSSKWISAIVDYRPAPGQFLNKAPGNMESAQGIIGKKGMVTLGAYGGYIDFMFDHTVVNQEGADFVIHGNAFAGSSEAGAVMVAADVNGNGKPDTDEWFELKGSEYENSIKDYIITYTKPSQTAVAEDVLWSDNKGGTGKITAIQFHKQCYYPLFLSDNPNTLTFKGNRVPNNATENNGIWTIPNLKGGYVDNLSDDYGTIVNDDQDTKNSNKFDISNAIDKNGNSKQLKGIDFIRVYNCLNQEAGWLGECSTEVCGAISLTVKAK